MNLKPRSELRIIAAVAFCVSVLLLGGTGVMMPNILVILRSQEMFSNRFYYHHITAMIRETFFIAFPCIAAINAWVAWKVLKHSKSIADH
jgi:hypothetical protein